jgi:asparagine synthase (glutamine-hydrolysing)
MCGIFGVWHRDGKPVDLTAVQYATTTLRHRGPDDEGYLLVHTQTGQTVACGGKDTDPRLRLPRIEEFFGKPFNLVLGHRRLAILDLSPAGHQPMGSAHGALWLIYNGEIYNYLELRTELKEYGHIFRTDTDTEVILAAYQQWIKRSSVCLWPVIDLVSNPSITVSRRESLPLLRRLKR